MDEATSMRMFVQVVRAESFSEAARRLDLTPSSVSRTISGLEDNLGVRLLNRTTRRLQLTVEVAVQQLLVEMVRHIFSTMSSSPSKYGWSASCILRRA